MTKSIDPGHPYRPFEATSPIDGTSINPSTLTKLVITLRRLASWLVLTFVTNMVLIVANIQLLPLAFGSVSVGIFAYLWFSIRPRWRDHHEEPRTLRALVDGFELLLAAGVCTLVNLIWWIILSGQLVVADSHHQAVFVATIIVGIVLILGLSLNGYLRLVVGSRRIRPQVKVLIAALWWFPPAIIILLGRANRTAVQEIRTSIAQHGRTTAQVCRTRHPILLVHGISFRDWEEFNYWGRIPDALIANGATISYGCQDAFGTVADCGQALVAAIEMAAATTGKVNVIAHSKGGLDTRWAISQEGMADKVASLTTINTPHLGCNFARQLLERIPKQAQKRIGQVYEALFTKLGDPDPDFLASISDLTDTECARLNQLMPDALGVAYFSVGSRMKSRFASPFPFNLGYSLIEPLDGDNDGLVAVTSMRWGQYLGTVEPASRRGISHADIVDLMRHDIKGFDVREFYIQLVSELRQRGF